MIVIAGKEKGKTSSIVRVFPKENRVLLDATNLVKRHRRPSQKNRVGQIIDKPMPIHASNVQIVDPKSGKPSRVGIKKDDKGGRTRVAIKSGQAI